jgi:hypothetical protein
MSTAPPTAQPAPVSTLPPDQREVLIYSHSALFYWWPVWAVGFLMALITFVDGHRLAVVPMDTKAEAARQVEGHQDPRDVLIVPKGAKLPRDAYTQDPIQPYLHMAHSKNLGIVYATVLLIIIVISNVPLRGLWSLLVILFIVLLVVIFALAGWWGWILERLTLLDIRINAGGYIFISLVLFIIWAVTVFIFDHRTYVAVTPGQVRVCLAVGAGETVYDPTGMTFQKRQDDLFRHWIVGLGSGDLIIHRQGTTDHIDMPNVLFVGAKVRQIETLIKERKVV